MEPIEIIKQKQPELKTEDIKILHLNLKKQWFNLIDKGVKLEEYREIKPYWEKRLLDYKAIKQNYQALVLKRYMMGIYTDVCKAFPKGYTHDLIRNGYTKQFIIFTIDEIKFGIGNPNWGAPIETVFIITFARRLT
jgi:hypothetical protein